MELNTGRLTALGGSSVLRVGVRAFLNLCDTRYIEVFQI